MDATPPVPGLSRRHLLGGGLLLAAGYVAAHAVGHRPVGGPAGRALSVGPRATLQAALEAQLPRDAPVAAITADVDRFLAAGDPVVLGQLDVALLLLEHLGGAGPIGFRRFTRLDRDARVAVLERWRVAAFGPKRQIAGAVRRIALFSYYSRPAVWPAIGYDGPLVGR
ncbi:MAG: hypothetical protein R3F59_34260 [Myxococcota bacterium]